MAIDKLFSHDASSFTALAFPLRAVWRRNDARPSDAPVQFLISVPKKKLRHAVDRVAMRRRVREAYRLLHHQYPLPDGVRVDVAFVYVATDLQPYAKVQKAMTRLLEQIAARDYKPADATSGDESPVVD